MAGLLEPDKYFKAYQYPTVDACIDFINRFVFTYDPRQK
jgi:hypothetical protein